MWTLADLGAVVGLLLDSFGGGGVGGLLLHLDYVWRAGLGGGGEAPDGEGGGPVWVEALGLQLGLRQEHLSPLHLLLQLLVVGLQGARTKEMKAGRRRLQGSIWRVGLQPSSWCRASAWSRRSP